MFILVTCPRKGRVDQPWESMDHRMWQSGTQRGRVDHTKNKIKRKNLGWSTVPHLPLYDTLIQVSWATSPFQCIHLEQQLSQSNKNKKTRM